MVAVWCFLRYGRLMHRLLLRALQVVPLVAREEAEVENFQALFAGRVVKLVDYLDD